MAKKYLAVDTSSPDYPLVEGSFFNKFDCYTEFINAVESIAPDMLNYKIISERVGQRPRREVLIECSFKGSEFSDTPFFVYVCPLEGGGRYEGEQRIQFCPSNRWSPALHKLEKAHRFLTATDKTGLETYVLGIYKPSESDNDIVFSGLYPNSIVTTETDNNKNSTSSVQVRISSIQRAYQTGVDMENTSTSYPIINFTPKNLFWYMINRDNLHVGDLEKVAEFVKTRKTTPLPILKIDKLEPLQQIIFGAPGTGKSFAIKSNKNIREQNSIRTTFHPDSDYSTFVGCYKPTKKERVKEVLIPLSELISLSREQINTEQRVKFICKYAESIKAAAKESGVSDNQIIRNEEFFNWNSDTYMMNFLNEILEERAKFDDSEITYDFIPQAFTNAYVAAWKDLDNPFFLIIEEINRGNCAQIFGDIFQLLDRDEQGYSSYKTTPDQDLANYIRRQLADADIQDEEVKQGRKMQLPPNLHIWATMNTSDQSLFPIDSAFKRRWDWKYIPIDYTDRGHFIACGDSRYSWVDFLQKVNEKVESVTQSEDKKLGYWFSGNGPEQKEISVERFVSKVVFYLWNDVFKDFGQNGNTIFKDTFDKFHKFFDYSGSPKPDVVKAFLDALEVKYGVCENTDLEDTSVSGIDYTKYSFDEETRLSKQALGEKIVNKYLAQNPNLSFAQIQSVFAFDSSVDSKFQYKGVVAKSDDISGSYERGYGSEHSSSDGVKFRVFKWWNKYNIDFIIKFARAQGWSVAEETK